MMIPIVVLVHWLLCVRACARVYVCVCARACVPRLVVHYLFNSTKFEVESSRADSSRQGVGLETGNMREGERERQSEKEKEREIRGASR